MKRFSIFALSCSFALATFALAGCKKDEMVANQTSTVALEFEQTVGADPLVLDTQTYNTLAGDQFKVNTFRQYISNIFFIRTDGSTYAVPESYYLIDAAKKDTQRFTLTGVPEGDYKGLIFTIGVDSARNQSGAQKGALDPSNNMFWTWNSGYIFSKFEGTSPQARKAGGPAEGGLVFHIGGFKKPNNAIRTVSLAFPSGTTLLVRTDHSPEIHLNVDLLKLFSGPATIRFAMLSDVQSPGSNAMLMANNYAAGLYSVEHIHAN